MSCYFTLNAELKLGPSLGRYCTRALLERDSQVELASQADGAGPVLFSLPMNVLIVRKSSAPMGSATGATSRSLCGNAIVPSDAARSGIVANAGALLRPRGLMSSGCFFLLC